MDGGARPKQQPNATLRAIRGLRQALDDHVAHDAREFDAVRAEMKAIQDQSIKATDALRTQLTTLTTRQGKIAETQDLIADALRVRAKDGESKPKGKPILLMSRWELLWKVGGAAGGLVLVYRIIWDSWPFIVGIAKVIAHVQ
jgi:hypothetical protein